MSEPLTTAPQEKEEEEQLKLAAPHTALKKSEKKTKFCLRDAADAVAMFTQLEY